MAEHVLTRIPAYRLGLLEPPAALEVREHLRACAPCRGAFEPFTEVTDEEESRYGHLPIALLVRWDALAPHLTEDERDCLEEHLETCERCSSSREFARDLRILAQERPARARRAWLGFGTAAMAAVVAVAVVVALRERPAMNHPVIPSKEAAPRVAAPVEVRAPAVSLSTDRDSAPLVVRVPEGATILPIRVPPLLGVGPDARIRITVYGPGGVEFGRTELEHRLLFGTTAGPALDARAPEGPLPAGKYRVSVAGGPERATYEFELVKNP